MNDRVQLIEYDAMCAQIARVTKVDEVKDIRDKHKAMQAYANQAMNFDAERQCAQIRIRAERRAGELLAETAERGERATRQNAKTTRGNHVESSDMMRPPSLPEIGISRDQSSQWQKLAKVPEPEFEEALAAPGIPSTSAIIESHKAKTAAKPESSRQQISDEALWLWGRLLDFERMGFFDADANLLLDEMTTNMRADCMRVFPLLLNWLEKSTCGKNLT